MNVVPFFRFCPGYMVVVSLVWKMSKYKNVDVRKEKTWKINRSLFYSHFSNVINTIAQVAVAIAVVL